MEVVCSNLNSDHSNMTPEIYFTNFEFVKLKKIVAYRRCHEKTSYVSNYAFFTLLYKWTNRGQTHCFENFQ